MPVQYAPSSYNHLLKQQLRCRQMSAWVSAPMVPSIAIVAGKHDLSLGSACTSLHNQSLRDRLCAGGLLRCITDPFKLLHLSKITLHQPAGNAHLICCDDRFVDCDGVFSNGCEAGGRATMECVDNQPVIVACDQG
jgi:hypothetical protein